MKVLMKILNEEHEIGRCIKDFHDESWVDEIIVVDGGSSDYTVHEANQFKKVKVYVHPYLDWFHAMEITQANVLLSYANHGEICFLIDADEKLSVPLKDFLAQVDEKGILPHNSDLVHIPRRTIEVLRHEDSPYCVYGEDGWPIESHQTGQFPDYQPRLIQRSYEMHWAHSPHRILLGFKKNYNLELMDAYIIHFEKDDIRKRHSIERRWLRPDATRKKLGLAQDMFETTAKSEYAEAVDPDFWRDGK